MHEIIPGEYPNDSFIKFYGDEFFEYNGSIGTGNCISSTFVFSAPDDCIIACDCDGIQGSRIIYEGNRIKIIIIDSSTEYIMQSNAVADNVYHFIEIYSNVENGVGKIYINGTDQTDTNLITGITSVSNSNSFKIGGTDQTGGINTGIVTIGFFSFWIKQDWFTTDSDFQSQYDDYTLNKLNPNFPIGGPNAYQMIDESRQSYLQTPPSVVNLSDEITLENVTINSLLSFNAGNYIGSDPVDGFSITGSGATVEYEQASEFQDDSSVLIEDGEYLLKDDEFEGLSGDFAIEAVLKKDTGEGESFIFGYGDSADTNPQARLRVVQSPSGGQYAHLVARDDNSNILNYFYSSTSVNFSNWTHLFMIYRKTGQISYYINGIRIQTATETALDGNIYYSGNEFRIGSVDGQPVNDYPINITMLKIFNKFDWLSTSQQDTFVSDRYSDYQNGGINYHTPIPITVHIWGDDIGTIPIFMTLDKNGIWQLQHVGSTSSTEEIAGFTVNDGLYGVKLFSKFEEHGFSNWDDINATNASIQKIQISKKYERVFKRIVAQTKPLSTWAILMIEWV